MYIGLLIAQQIYKLSYNMMEESIEKQYGKHLRLRVAGLCNQNDKILVVNHTGLNNENEFWAPPGGGLHYGESVKDCLLREFLEETGLKIAVGDFLHATEYLKPPLHAIELFFAVEVLGGSLIRGTDPEVGVEDQIIANVEFMSFDTLLKIPDSRKHNIFHGVKKFERIFDKKGYSKFP